MNTNNPMTQERLDAIQERVDSVEFPDDEHLTVVNGEENLVAWVERSRLDGSVVSGAVVATVHAGSRSAEMFAHAPEDLADLLAEVERLRALTTVDDDMVERVAQQLWAEMDTWASAAWCNEWARQPEHTRNAYRSHARAALNAALGTGERS